MKLTKYNHACLTLEHEGKLLVIDPGVWTTDLGVYENVVGIIVTHEHADHFDPTALGAIIAHNPEAKVIAHTDITRQLGTNGETLPYETVSAGDIVTVGPFTLEFFGGKHATIHSDIPDIANLGVFVNDTLYYPGDSFARPERPVSVLALPVSAPWLKISETMDFLTDTHPKLAFPTHDAILSDEGKGLVDRMLTPLAEKTGGQYQRLSHDHSIEIG